MVRARVSRPVSRWARGPSLTRYSAVQPARGRARFGLPKPLSGIPVGGLEGHHTGALMRNMRGSLRRVHRSGAGPRHVQPARPHASPHASPHARTHTCPHASPGARTRAHAHARAREPTRAHASPHTRSHALTRERTRAGARTHAHARAHAHGGGPPTGAIRIDIALLIFRKG